MSWPNYYEYCQRCRQETPHRFLYRRGLKWIYQRKICGTIKTDG